MKRVSISVRTIHSDYVQCSVSAEVSEDDFELEQEKLMKMIYFYAYRARNVRSYLQQHKLKSKSKINN